MDVAHQANADQIAYWNGPSGQRWADRQAAQESCSGLSRRPDRPRQPKAGERVSMSAAAPARPVCVAKASRPAASCSASMSPTPMLSQARAVCTQGLPLDFVLADATVYPFEPASFDLLASRFGVMFFADPVASFTNLRRALKPTGRLAFACWREPKENPWMMAPLKAVYKHVPKMPPVGPEEPGPFAFASEERVMRILKGAGFVDVAMEPHNLPWTSRSAAGSMPRSTARSRSVRRPRAAGPSAGDVRGGQEPRSARRSRRS